MKFNRQRIEDFIHARGFKTLSAFSRATGIDNANVRHNVTGEIRPGIDRMFIFASVLHADITQIIYLFYPEKYSALIAKNNAYQHKIEEVAP